MPREETVVVIADVDATVVRWLGRLAPDVEIVFALPHELSSSETHDGGTTLTVFLYDIREDPDAGVPGWTTMRDEMGAVVGRQPPARSYRFTYVLTASGADPRSEHEALGQVLCGSVFSEVVADDDLCGQMKGSDGYVIIRCAPEARRVDATELWSGWGMRPRTSLELSVSAPMPPPAPVDVADPPTRVVLGADRHRDGVGRGAGVRRPTVPAVTAEVDER